LSEKPLSKRQKKLATRKDQGIVTVSNFNLKEVTPLTTNQQYVFDDFSDGQHLLIHGTAGTGKSFISLYLGLNAMFHRKYHKVIIFRSAVPTRDMGFLPGNEKEKAKIFEAPYKSICSELFGRGDAYEVLKQKDLLEFTTTSYVRGITLDNCVVIVDEIQNMTAHELDSIITRLGHNCRLIYCGDSAQTDFTRESDKGGLQKFLPVIERMYSFSIIKFGTEDIVRGPTVKEYIIAKEELNAVF
jgi:phosphate starvation-inducible PhoH-like protein